MTDREALAALLHPLSCHDNLGHVRRASWSPAGWTCERLADRLIAAGVTLAPSLDEGLLAVAKIVRRHTHQGLYAMTAYAGPEPEKDCHLCRALVAAGVLTIEGIGAGTRAALAQEGGVGWVEGGETLQTTCARCGGTGAEPPLYDPTTFDVDGAPFPSHVLDGDCWCDPLAHEGEAP